MRAFAAFLGVALACALAAQPAHADDEAASTELFNAGRDLMKQGNYAAACPKLAESVRLKATVGALAKLATCEEHEKRLASAYARWQQALNLAQSTGDDREPDVQKELARIDKIVPKLAVKAAGTLPADAEIRVDDTTLGAASLGVPLPVEPGAHTVAATATGKKPWSTVVTTAADGATTPVEIPRLEDAPAPPPSPPPTPTTTTTTTLTSTATPTATPTPTSTPWPTVGIVTGATGLASIAGGAILGFVAVARKSAAGCAGTVCPDASSASTLEDAKNAAGWSTGLFVAGGALTAAGVTIWLVSHGHTSPAKVGAAFLPGGLAVVGDWD